MLDDFEFWQRLFGNMSAGLQGALIGGSTVLFIVWLGFIVEARSPRVKNAVAKAVYTKLARMGFRRTLVISVEEYNELASTGKLEPNVEYKTYRKRNDG